MLKETKDDNEMYWQGLLYCRENAINASPLPKCFKIDKWMDRQRQREQQIKTKQGKNVTDKSEERVGVFLDIPCTIFAIFLCLELLQFQIRH